MVTRRLRRDRLGQRRPVRRWLAPAGYWQQAHIMNRQTIIPQLLQAVDAFLGLDMEAEDFDADAALAEMKKFKPDRKHRYHRGRR